MTPTGAPCRVLRCTIRLECPTTCDQACRDLAEAVVGPAVALLVLPAGHRELLFPRKGAGVHETGAVHLRALAFRPAGFAPSSGIPPNPSRRQTRQPFGGGEYSGDFTSDGKGRSDNTCRLIVAEAFASTLVNGQRVRVDLNQVGAWFADPTGDDFCLGPDSPVTPFDGDNEAGVQAFNSANTTPLPPP